MFKLVALLFVVVNGAPADKPSGSLSYNRAKFPTEEACEQFAASATGKATIAAITDAVAQSGAIARIACVKEAQPADDGSI
jgi:hypothetical protein